MCSPTDPFERALIAQLPALKRFAISLCRDSNAADDLVQDTVMRAIANRSQFEVGSNLGAWLTTILRNVFLTSRRRRKHEVEDPDGEMARRVPIEASALRTMEAQETLRLIDLLPETFRQPLRLVADGASYEEVAIECREHVGTIKSRINRARELLRGAS